MDTESLIVKYIDILSASMRKSTGKYKQRAEGMDLFKLTITQLHYLHAIKEMDGVTFKQLVERFNVQKSTVTDIINRLINRGIVGKRQSAEDLRVFHIYLTEKGNEILEMENRGYHDFACKMTDCLTPEESEQFAWILRKITAGIKE